MRTIGRMIKITGKTMILPALLTAIAWAWPGTASAQVLWEADTSRGTNVFEGLERAPGTIDVATDPKGVYGKVYRFHIWDNPEGKERCEAKGTRRPDGSNLRLTRGNTYFIGWRAMWNPLPTPPDRWVALFQMHAYGQPGMGAPLVLRTLGDGRLFLQNDVNGSNQHIWDTTLKKNTWEKFVLHVFMDPDPKKGWVELWYNGVRQTFYNGQTRFFCATHENEPDTYNRLKWGIYRTGRVDGDGFAYMSRARIGKRYEDVAP